MCVVVLGASYTLLLLKYDDDDDDDGVYHTNNNNNNNNKNQLDNIWSVQKKLKFGRNISFAFHRVKSC